MRGREPVHARRPVRRQPACAEDHGRGLRAAPALRVARDGLHLPERAASSPRPTRTTTPSCVSACPVCASPTRRRASAARCSRASSSRSSARSSAARARPSARSGPAWSRARAPAPPTTTTALRSGSRVGVTDGDLRKRTQGPWDHRDRPRQAGEVPRRPHHDGSRRRRQGDPGAHRGPARPRARLRIARGARRRRRRRGRRHAAGDDHRLVRGQAAALPGRLDRRPGRQRHGQRPRGRRRPAARADRCR